MYKNRLISLLLLTVTFFSCKEDKEPIPEVPITANFLISSRTVTEGGSVTFTDISTGAPTEWQWTFEGGTPATSTEKNPVVVYSTPGTYNVSLKASKNGNSDQETKEKVITVSTLCTANNNPDCAAAVTLSTSMKDKIGEKGQAKYYKVTLAQAGILAVAVSNIAADITLAWELTGSDKVSLASGRGVQGTRVAAEKLLGAGTYFLALSDYGNDNFSDQEYELLVSLDTDDRYELNNTFNTASPLTLGQTLDGTLRTDEDLDYFVFTTSQAGVVEVQLSNIDPELSVQAVVYDQDQNELGTSSYSTGGSLGYNILVGPGKHYLLLKGGKYANKTGEQLYHLNVSLNTDDPNELNNSFASATPFTFGQTLEGTFRTEGDLDYFALTVDKAGVIEVQLSNIDPELKIQALVYTENQAELGSSNFSNGGNLTYKLLVGPGKHYLLLKHGNYSYMTGKQIYNLKVSLNTDDPNELNNTFETATSLALGSTVPGAIRTAGDLDYFKFTVGQAGALEVQVSNIDPELRMHALIYDANQAQVASSYYSTGGNLTYTYNLAPGNYFLLLKAGLYSFSHGTQIYNLKVTLKP